jgi:ML domain
MNKFLIALTLIASSAALDSVAADSVGQKCSNSIEGFTVSSFTVSPFPPTKGGNFTINMAGKFNLQETVTGFSITFYLGILKFYTEVSPEYSTYYTGQIGNFTATQEIPSLSPNGSYKVVTSLINSSRKDINCWEFSYALQ